MILPTFVSIAGAFMLLGVVSGQLLRNITVDDTSPAITYTGSWKTGTEEADSYGGSHRSTSWASAYATFNFTGVAVYYMMPLFWGYTGGVSTLLTLDSGPAQLVNLTRVGSEPTTSAVRWSATGLTNGTHKVTISLGRSAKGELASWGQVDAFIYTVEGDVGTSEDAGDGSQTPSTALVSLQKCSPCGNSTCSFSPEGSPLRDTYLLVIGKPVSNCDVESNQTVTSQYTSETEVTETWTVDTSIGISFAGLNLQGGTGWSKSASVKASQHVSLSIPPGKMAALTATVGYKKTSGNMRIDSTPWSFSSIQPTDVRGYNVEYADCGDLFSAFTLSSADCTSKSAAYTNRGSLGTMALMGIMILWNMV